MPVTSNRRITIAFASDILYSQSFDAAANASGSGQNQLIDLVTGPNTITPPNDAVGVTIVPPDDNAVTLTLKGVTGDTGVPLSLVDPSSLGLASDAAFVITAGGNVTVRFIFS